MGLLNKYIKPVPLREDYRKRAKSDLLLFIGWGIALFLIALLLFGCSLEKKIAKTYRNAEAYNPLTKTDSLHLLRASKKVIKATAPPKVLPPKTIKVNVPQKVYVVDKERLKQLEDSLGIAAAEDANSIVDECVKNERKAKSEGIKIGIKEGYAQRNKELSADSLQIVLYPDTIPPDLETIAELNDARMQRDLYKDSLAAVTALYNDKKKQAKDRLWIIIVALAAFAFFGGMALKNKLKKSVSTI